MADRSRSITYLPEIKSAHRKTPSHHKFSHRKNQSIASLDVSQIEQTPQQRANTNDRYGNVPHRLGQRHGSLNPVVDAPQLSGLNNYESMMELMNTRNNAAKSYGVTQVSSSLLKPTTSLKIRTEIQKKKYKKPQNSFLVNNEESSSEEEDSDGNVKKKKKNKPIELTNREKEEIRLQQQIELMKQWQERLKISKLLTKEMQKQYNKQYRQKKKRKGKKKQNSDAEEDDEDENEDEGSQSPKSSHRPVVVKKDKFKAFDNPYVNYQLDLIDQTKFMQKKKRVKRSSSEVKTKGGKQSMADMWKQQEEKGKRIEWEKLPHYMALTARGKQAEQEIKQKKEEEDNPKPKKEHKRINLAELWKSKEGEEQQELPHYMSTTTAQKNYQQTLLQEIEEKKPKTPKKVEPRKKQAEVWKLSAVADKENGAEGEKKELPSYMKLTAAQEENLKRRKLEKEEEKQRKQKEEDLRNKKVQSNMRDMWRKQQMSEEQRKQEEQKNKKFVPSKRAPIAKALLKKWSKQPKIWTKFLQQISMEHGTKLIGQIEKAINDNMVDMANHYFEKYEKTVWSFLTFKDKIVEASSISLKLGEAQLKEDKIYMARDILKKGLEFRKYMDKYDNSTDQDFVMLKLNYAVTLTKLYQKKEEQKFKKEAKDNYKTCSKDLNNFYKEKEWCKEIMSTICQEGLGLGEADFVKEMAGLGASLTGDKSHFDKFVV